MVSIESKPEFVRKLQDFEVKEREEAILEVEITSSTANVTWHKVNNLILYLLRVLTQKRKEKKNIEINHFKPNTSDVTNPESFPRKSNFKMYLFVFGK